MIKEGDFIWVEKYLPNPVKVVCGIAEEKYTSLYSDVVREFIDHKVIYFDGIGEIQLDKNKTKRVKIEYRQVIIASINDIFYWKKYGNAPEEIRLKFI